MSLTTIRESMIIKHFYRHNQKLNNDQENLDHIFSAPNADPLIKDSKRQIAMDMQVLDDEEEDKDDLQEGFT